MFDKRFDYENYLFILVLYILCFVYLFSVNTEYICLILLLFLNLFYILLYYNDVDNSSLELFFMIPFQIPVRMILFIWWLLIIISNSWILNTFGILHKKFGREGVNFGSKKNHQMKNTILATLLISTVLLWVLHMISIMDLPLVGSMKIVLIMIGITITSISVYLNDELESNTKVIL